MFSSSFKTICRRGVVISEYVRRRSVRTMSNNNNNPRSFLKRGALIVFEGVDRSGKTTQADKLLQYLQDQGTDAELWKFPDRTTTIGKMIDNYLKCNTELDNKVIHLLFSSNRWEKRDEMMQKIRSGTTIVLDRYSYSGVAFSAAKNDPTLTLEWCKAPEVGLLCPDLVFFMQLGMEHQTERKGFGEERYENNEFQKKVLDCFMDLKDENWLIINAQNSVEQIHSQIVKEASQMVQVCNQGKSLTLLWDGRYADDNFMKTNNILEKNIIQPNQKNSQNHSKSLSQNTDGNNEEISCGGKRSSSDEVKPSPKKLKLTNDECEQQRQQVLLPTSAKN
eukprot:TRINITY_DN1436_c0_g1_i2.p2 TRINITY_DN1436_c0_g1~~TRINITY_DN1436_c0_g1_i2.p2  ORF type:complete len:335 (+),score=47.09 TRINITY_DN1436_c0_g1_i2:77-1081(+)